MSRIEDGVNSRAKSLLLFAFGVSLAVHGVAYASLVGRSFAAPAQVEVSTVSFEVQAPPPPEPRAPSRTPEAPSVRSVTPAPARAASPQAPPATLTPLPAAPQAAALALDLSGVTLTNDLGSGFAIPVGNGSALRGPIGSGGGRTATATLEPKRGARGPEGPVVVSARDLSEQPRPPTLDGLLRANYPEQARQRGLRGIASVRARIDADGVIRSVRLVSESFAGFGAACLRTVSGSHWSAPRAKNGDAVATEIVYTCHFEVD